MPPLLTAGALFSHTGKSLPVHTLVDPDIRLEGHINPAIRLGGVGQFNMFPSISRLLFHWRRPKTIVTLAGFLPIDPPLSLYLHESSKSNRTTLLAFSLVTIFVKTCCSTWRWW